MTNALREKIQALGKLQVRSLACDWEKFEREGLIDDCYLRRFTQIYMKETNIPSHNVVRVMQDVAFESFRFLAGY